MSEDGFDPAIEIEALPKRLGIGFEQACTLIDEMVKPIRDHIMESYSEQGYTEEQVLGDVTILAVGGDANRPGIVRWTQKGNWKRGDEPYTRDHVGAIAWPDEYGSTELGQFNGRLQSPGKPLPLRAKSAMKYAGGLGIYATRSFTMRQFSQEFGLVEVWLKEA